MGAQIKGRGRRSRGGGFRDINVTPLVDVMLVLLIVFMVTAPLLTTGLKIALPEVQAAQTPVKDARLLVTVTADNKVFFGEKEITGRVSAALAESVRVQKEQELYIRADKDARYGVVAEVVAAARANGVSSLNLLVQPEEESKGSQDEVPLGAKETSPSKVLLKTKPRNLNRKPSAQP